MVLNTYVSTDQLGQGAKQPKQDDQENEDVEISDISDEDVERLNTQLDQLNNALDVLEQKNENIQARLLELLKSNKELREEQSREES
ncbi:uncharacterized protein [Rhodnius prolixus]|uniref:Uncharacterized protein n=2 Tax=Rhodnius TaxID=13248 RepID=T1I6N8_RHOPR